MKIPMKIFYSGEGFTSDTLGQVWLLRARLPFRLVLWKSRHLVYYKPLFTDAAWHKVPLDALQSVVSAENQYEAMSNLRNHPDYKPPVL